ncbi:MAG: lipid-A-disaccharide synthase N-terminal domain-containing protein [Gemmatimonadota bacterium]
MTPEQTWVGVGLAGQACFFSRFLVQWVASERRGRSVVPRAFWYLSIAGGLTLLSYSLWRRDPVFILGQSVGLFVYLRNLVLLRREDETGR